jgi:hypothetical protein
MLVRKLLHTSEILPGYGLDVVEDPMNRLWPLVVMYMPILLPRC